MSKQDPKTSRTRFTGSLGDVSIGDLFQTLEMAGKPSEVEFETDVGRALVWFRDRAIVDAECGEVRGADAIYRLAMADDGTFTARFQESERPAAIRTSPQFLVMEAARRRDEWLERAGPGLRGATRLVPVAAAIAAGQGALDADARALLGRLDGEVQLIDLVAPGDEEAAALFRPIRALLGAGLVTAVERPFASSLSMQAGAIEVPEALGPPPSFWAQAVAAARLLAPALRALALAALALGAALAVLWVSGRALVGGLLVAWALLLLGHALGRRPWLPLRRPLLVVAAPVAVVADLLDRAGVALDFVRRGRELAARSST